MDKAKIRRAASRLMMWKIPEWFSPDGYIRFDKAGASKDKPSWPTGTNLMGVDQAVEMFEHCFAEEPPTTEVERLEAAVDAFAEAMKAKLRQKHKEGYTGWDDPNSRPFIQATLRYRATTPVGEAVNIANCAMFLWNLRNK